MGARLPGGGADLRRLQQALRRVPSGPPRREDPLFERYQVLTDLAVEARELLIQQEGPPELPGVVVENEATPAGTLTRVHIESEVGARLMGKVQGHYATLGAPALRERDRKAHDTVATVIAAELGRFLKLVGAEDAPVLVVGLGNWQATPDALGPRVVEQLLVTRHLWNRIPPARRGQLRPVSAIAPGVLGLTGMETEEIVRGVVAATRPGCIVCVDALAARSASRLGTTVQIADVGVTPGSGVGNTRRGITAESLGVPVIAIGVPTVVHAVTLVSDGIVLMEEAAAGARGTTPPLPAAAPPAARPGGPPPPPPGAGIGAALPGPEVPAAPRPGEGPRLLRPGLPEAPTAAELEAEGRRRALIRQRLPAELQDLVVTPKEIDVLVDDLAGVLANGLNTALHPGLDLEEVLQFL